MTAAVLILLAATLAYAGYLAQRLTKASRRIDADVLFLRSIPSDLDWREDGGSNE
jgi:hypothetical protein